MAKLEQGLWLTEARGQQQFMAEDICNIPLTLFSQDSHSNHKTKKHKGWGIGFSNKDGKKNFRGHGAVEVKRLKTH